MALLTKYVLTEMQAEMVANNINSYLYIAPQDATGIFCTMFPYSTVTEYTFNEIMDSVNIQVSIFNKDDASALLDLGSDIFDLFSEYEAYDGTSRIFCSKIVNQRGPEYLAKEEYWQYVMELTFNTIKDKI